ncbi:hypothetical protein IGI04_001628 [Brassica rapa subsp. trilocularis]|uniref:DUF287 domain-containing protein n=1 Tax=Brassica rapa subsp. trilocularis TaxID=1813537 RepID=A0ABQ7NT69_BRACM|nr:hypothetical protein IGI04_001628 [Brassica rapa subsp. trilocularis]
MDAADPQGLTESTTEEMANQIQQREIVGLGNVLEGSEVLSKVLEVGEQSKTEEMVAREQKQAEEKRLSNRTEGTGLEEGNQTGGKGLENLSRGSENGVMRARILRRGMWNIGNVPLKDGTEKSVKQIISEREDMQSNGDRRENEEERKKNEGKDAIIESNEEVLGEQKTNVEEDIEEGEMVGSWSDVTPENASKSSSSLKFGQEKLLTPSRFSALLEVDENGDRIKPIEMEKVLSIEEVIQKAGKESSNGGKNVTEEGGIEEQTGGGGGGGG